jgi:hypothetical protein
MTEIHQEKLAFLAIGSADASLINDDFQINV